MTKHVKWLGFTLIEIIVVIAVIAITLPVLFTIIFAITKQQLKIYRLSEVKRQGDYALNVIENNIRNYAIGIYSDSGLTTTQCALPDTEYSSTTGPFYIKTKSNTYIRFYENNNKIIFAIQTPAGSSDLTSSKLIVENFTLHCKNTATYSPPIVDISFDTCYNIAGACTSSRVEETASLHYQTSVKLRSY